MYECLESSALCDIADDFLPYDQGQSVVGTGRAWWCDIFSLIRNKRQFIEKKTGFKCVIHFCNLRITKL